ncbi:PD-(D/E)XK nuclease family protein [Pannus brasiliensis CCIBt3594]|uniref:PD-(D/E)XK nuclease family protein n=1 Tax=Pannus brasiliensis CCIBt3594 TaxID=1427578 RepID=A0AAW9QMP8_9CHRO
MNKTTLVRLSQGHLNLLETCPPRFQRIYLDRLATPPDLENWEKQEWGSQFHRLLQQRELGLPIDGLLREDPQLQHSLNALLEAAPEILHGRGEIDRSAEHCRTLSVGNYLLTVIYDLLRFESDRATIFDWKTYLKPEKPDKLARNWQTRLYLYVLAETSSYSPDRLSMTYWFVRLPREPESLTFAYSRELHERTRQDLTRLLDDLDRWLDDYEKGIPFPHRGDCETNCPYGKSIGILPRAGNSIEGIDSIGEIDPFA